jgi:hypothetical protein
MIGTQLANIVRTISLGLLQLVGGIFAAMALGCSLIGTLLPYRTPHSRLYTFLQLLVCLGAVLIGVATIFRFRIAAIGVAVCFLYLCADEAYGMAHGFFLPKPPHYSTSGIVTQLLVGFIPAILIALAWPYLRSIWRTI